MIRAYTAAFAAMKFRSVLARKTCNKVMKSEKLEEAFFGLVNRIVYNAGFSKSEKRLPYRVYSILVKLMITAFVGCELWYMFTECTTYIEVVDSINVSVINLMAIYRYKNMMNNKEIFKKLAKAMELPHFDVVTTQRKSKLQYWIKINEDYTKLLLGLGHFTLLIWYIYPLIDDIEYNLCLKIKMPFFYQTPTLYPIAYTLVVLTFHVTALFVMINDLLMQTHLIHLICQFSVLGDCFENLLIDCLPENEANVSDTQTTDKRFQDQNFASKCVHRYNDLIEQHKILLRHAQELRSILSIPMMGQVVISGTLICFAGYQVTQAVHAGIAKLLMSLLYLGYNMFELLIFCRWSDEINVQSQHIRDSAYCCGWEQGLATVPGMRLRVMLVITRATKPLVLTAGGMYNLSLESYSSLVKASYSALTMLLQLEKEDET